VCLPVSVTHTRDANFLFSRAGNTPGIHTPLRMTAELRRRTVHDEIKTDVEVEFVARGDAPLLEHEMRAQEFNRVWRQGLTMLTLLACGVYLQLALHKRHAVLTPFHLSSVAAALACLAWLATDRPVARWAFASLVVAQWFVLLGIYMSGQPSAVVYKCMPTTSVLFVVTATSLECQRRSAEMHREERQRMERRLAEETSKRLN